MTGYGARRAGPGGRCGPYFPRARESLASPGTTGRRGPCGAGRLAAGEEGGRSPRPRPPLPGPARGAVRPEPARPGLQATFLRGPVSAGGVGDGFPEGVVESAEILPSLWRTISSLLSRNGRLCWCGICLVGENISFALLSASTASFQVIINVRKVHKRFMVLINHNSVYLWQDFDLPSQIKVRWPEHLP